MGNCSSFASSKPVEEGSIRKSVRITLQEGSVGKYVVYERVYVCRQARPTDGEGKKTACVSVHAFSRPPKVPNVTFSSEVALRKGATDLDFCPIGPLSKKVHTQRVAVGTCRHLNVRVVAMIEKPLPKRQTFLIPVELRIEDEAPSCCGAE